MKKLKTLINKNKKNTRSSIAGLILLGTLTMNQTAFAQTERAEKWICEYGTGSGGDGEYMRNLKFEHGSWGLAFCTGSTPKMMINYDGHTGVGTTAAQLDNLGYGRSFRIHDASSSQFLMTDSNISLATAIIGNKAYIGTRTSDDFNFTTNDRTRMTITSGGNFGFGTMTPSSFSYGPNMHIVGARRSRILLESERYGQVGQVYMNSYADSDGDRGLYIGTTSDHLTHIQANSKKGITVRYDDTAKNAYVGIGTSNPRETLHVNGNIRGHMGPGAIRIRTDYGDTEIGAKNAEWSHFYTDRDKYFFNKPIYINSGFLSSYNSDVSFATGNNGSNTPTTRMTIAKATGNVGIGIDPHATSKVYVDGEVRASNFISSAASFPDYVFEEDYTIMPLETLETYVNQHKHLPNMPSEKEVVSKGLNIPLVVDRSVENIETIYLHLIEMQKGMKRLENKVKVLEEENKKLKTALHN